MTSTAQMAIRYSVPMIADWMPEFSGITRDGKLVMKSQDNTPTPSLAKSQMIAPRPRKAIPTAVYMSRTKPVPLAASPCVRRGMTVSCVRAAAAICAPVIAYLRGASGPRSDDGPRHPASSNRSLRSLIHLPVLADEPDRDDVQHQRQEEQRDADGEDRQVLDRAGRDVTPRLRRDVGRHGLEALARVEPEVRRLAAGDEHEHGLADRARRTEDQRGDDAGQRGREHDPQ